MEVRPILVTLLVSSVLQTSTTLKLDSFKEFLDKLRGSLTQLPISLNNVLKLHTRKIICTNLKREHQFKSVIQFIVDIKNNFLSQIETFSSCRTGIAFQSYPSVPVVVSKTTFLKQHVQNIKDHFIKPINKNQFLSFGMLCQPPLQVFSNKPERQGFSIFLTEHKTFHFNLSFVDFTLPAHRWCCEGYVNVEGTVAKQLPEYIFCGKRHPWSLYYLSHTISIWAIATKFSRFSMLYDVIDFSQFQCFHMKQFSPYFGVYYTDSQLLDRDMRVKAYATHSIALRIFSRIVKMSVHYISVWKCQFLLLYNNCFCHVFDGPSVSSKMLSSETNNTFLKMSSFQATVTFEEYTENGGHSFYFENKFYKVANVTVYTFRGQDNFNRFEAVSENNHHINFVISKEYASNVFETRWFAPPTNMSLNISVDSVHYSGPEEEVNTDWYGGVAVYFVEDRYTLLEHYKEYEEVLFVKRMREEKHHVVSTRTTNYVVVVYHFNTEYSSLTAKVSVAKSNCIGRYFALEQCEPEGIRLLSRKGIICKISLRLYDNLDPRVEMLLSAHNIGQVTNLRSSRKCIEIKLKQKSTQQQQIYIFPSFKDTFNYSFFDFEVKYFSAIQAREISMELYMLPYQAELTAEYVFLEDFGSGRNGYKASTRGAYYMARKFYGIYYPKIQPDFFHKLKNESEYLQTIVLSENRNPLHHRITTAGPAPRHWLGLDSIRFFMNRLEMEGGWAEVLINVLTCSGRETRSPLVQHALKLACWGQKQVAEGEYFSTLVSNLNASQAVVPSMPVYSATGEEVFETFNETAKRIVFVQESRHLHQRKSTVGVPKLNMFVHGHLSSFSQSGKIIVKWHQHLPQFSFALNDSQGFFNIFLPLVHLPICAKLVSPFEPFQPCALEILADIHLRSLPIQLEFSSPANSKLSNQSVFHNHTRLVPQCTEESCMGKFLSWNEASYLCEAQEMHLPSIHSLDDVNKIKEQVDIWQEHISRTRNYTLTAMVQDPDTSLHEEEERTTTYQVLYQTVGIYVGLNTKVGVRLNPQKSSTFL